MFRILAGLFILSSFSLSGQNGVTGKIDPPENISWILLYKMENGEEVYVNNAEVINGNFSFALPKEQTAGVYRAYYQIENKMFVEFLYNQQAVHFTFDPKKPFESVRFTNSEENNLYLDYYETIFQKQRAVDTVQVLYFESADAKTDKKLIKDYQTKLEELKKTQGAFEKRSENTLVNHFIKSSTQYNSETPFKKPADYLNTGRMHYFDKIDFSDPALKNSSFLTDKMNDYVFHLNQAENKQTSDELQKKAILDVKAKLTEDRILEEKFYRSLIKAYLDTENVEMVKFVLEQYKTLPKENRDNAFLGKTSYSLKTTIGSQAPDLNWKENGMDQNLYKLSGSDYYIVVFFSSTCSHCQKEMPVFHDFIKEIGNVKVLAIGLEDEKTLDSYKNLTAPFTDFILVLEKESWESKKARDYGVTEIPGYFVLDSNKKIIAKPEDVEELKSMFVE
jgi:thiol-disulfide isomerase/thioredoxin